MAQFRDTRLAGNPDQNGMLRPRSDNTVRLALAAGRLFTVAIKDWCIGLLFNSVSNIDAYYPAQAATGD